jgi:hypothetical protein
VRGEKKFFSFCFSSVETRQTSVSNSISDLNQLQKTGTAKLSPIKGTSTRERDKKRKKGTEKRRFQQNPLLEALFYL